jgi:hypothetical protein
MSALGQEQKFAVQEAISALGQKQTCSARADVRFGSLADILRNLRDVRLAACLLRERDSPLRGLALSSVNLSANKCYGALINRSRIPCLDGREIGFPRLVSCTSAPAMSLKEICC